MSILHSHFLQYRKSLILWMSFFIPSSAIFTFWGDAQEMKAELIRKMPFKSHTQNSKQGKDDLDCTRTKYNFVQLFHCVIIQSGYHKWIVRKRAFFLEQSIWLDRFSSVSAGDFPDRSLRKRQWHRNPLYRETRLICLITPAYSYSPLRSLLQFIEGSPYSSYWLHLGLWWSADEEKRQVFSVIF